MHCACATCQPLALPSLHQLISPTSHHASSTVLEMLECTHVDFWELLQEKKEFRVPSNQRQRPISDQLPTKYERVGIYHLLLSLWINEIGVFLLCHWCVILDIRPHKSLMYFCFWHFQLTSINFVISSLFLAAAQKCFQPSLSVLWFVFLGLQSLDRCYLNWSPGV